jgi:hypothetical protein
MPVIQSWVPTMAKPRGGGDGAQAQGVPAGTVSASGGGTQAASSRGGPSVASVVAPSPASSSAESVHSRALLRSQGSNASLSSARAFRLLCVCFFGGGGHSCIGDEVDRGNFGPLRPWSFP